MEVVQLPTYKGFFDFPEFLADFEDRVSEPQRLLALDDPLKATPTGWWVTHKKSINGWLLCRRLMEVKFVEANKYQVDKYDG